MLAWLKYLLKPLDYLSITYGTGVKSKLFLDCIAPVILITTTSLLSYFANGRWPVMSAATLDDILSFLILAFPFYVAALTAISSFPNSALDQVFSGGDDRQAYIKVWDNDEQKIKKVALTRRRFVARIFGYLSLISLLIIIALIFEKGFELSGFLHMLPPFSAIFITNTMNFFLWILIANIMFVTLMALRFLIYRVGEA